MNIVSRREGDIARVVVAGELDLATSAELRDGLAELLARDGAPHVLIDLAEVTFCDSSGVEALVLARTVILEQGRTVALVNARGVTRSSLEITGVLELYGEEPNDGRQ